MIRQKAYEAGVEGYIDVPHTRPPDTYTSPPSNETKGLPLMDTKTFLAAVNAAAQTPVIGPGAQNTSVLQLKNQAREALQELKNKGGEITVVPVKALPAKTTTEPEYVKNYPPPKPGELVLLAEDDLQFTGLEVK